MVVFLLNQSPVSIAKGNDPLYGGLGGEFTYILYTLYSFIDAADELFCSVITASELNGPIVLRHELGHSIIEVGEEYDGGKYLPVDRDKALQCPNC